MPAHDWTRAYSGLFHNFHQSWTAHLAGLLNTQILPAGYYALLEYKSDIPAQEISGRNWQPQGPPFDAEPREESHEESYARRANRISIRQGLDEVVAVIEIVSPGSKHSPDAFRLLVNNASAFLKAGIHLLLIDLFPPSAQDPNGIDAVIAGTLGYSRLPSPKKNR